jgi:hypothetical protein
MFGIFLATAPIGVLLWSMIVGFSSGETRLLAALGMLPALACAFLNFWLSFIRPNLYRKRHGGMEGFKNVSGIPIVGTIFLLVAVYFSFGSVAAAIVGLIACMCDTGGITWFVIATWKDEGLWDR